MNKNTKQYPTIGKLLYIIQNADTQEKDFLQSFPHSSNRYNQLKNRYYEMDNNPQLLNNIFNQIPKQCCLAHDSFLKNNDDFFIAYTILSKTDSIHINNSDQFIHHLNNCYWCFIEYNQFINDEYFTFKELETDQTGVL